MNALYTNAGSDGYLLSLLAVADELRMRAIFFREYNLSQSQNLAGVRLYQPGSKLASAYLWIVRQEHANALPPLAAEICFVLLGEAPLPQKASAVILPAQTDPAEILTVLLEVFEKFALWDRELHWAMHQKNPLDAMITASLPIFQNPILLHDKDFYVLSCPRWLPGMLDWGKEPRTGRNMVPLDLINTFRVNEEYLATMKQTQASLFPANIRDYNILYANLWNNTYYSGRICVDEIQRPLMPSDYQHLDHLAALVEGCMNQQRLLWLSIGSEIDAFFADMLSGKDSDPHVTADMLQYLGWDSSEMYAILKVVSDQDNYRVLTPTTLFGYIEAQIGECHALIYQQEIVVIVNLTASGLNTSEVLSRLAYILRDGMFKIGVSSEIPSIQGVRYGYAQASVALEYGRRSNSMFWYYHFRDYALQFALDCACEKIPPQLLISEKLQKLRRYDLQNNTELYRTAEVYLRQERNAVLTAKALFIHRSTLFYRLNRIETISGIDFENERERLYLLLSFHMDQE